MPFSVQSILDHLDQLAVIAGGLFAGTALYISFGEVPALRAFGLDEHWRFFPYMYAHAAPIQIGFTLTAGISSILHGTRIIGSVKDRNLWLVAGSIFVGMIPYTILCIAPTNQRIIKDNQLVHTGKESQINVATRKDLLDKWVLLHFARTAGSIFAFSAMVFGLHRHSSLILGW